MSVAVERPAGSEAPAAAAASAPSGSGAAAAAVLLLGVAALVAAAIFVGDGSSNGVKLALGTGALLLAVLAWTAVLAGLLPRPDAGALGIACIVLLAALSIWSLFSILWSIAPDRSWDAFNRSLVYLVLLCLGVAAAAVTRRAPTLAAAGLGLGIAVALAWSLAGKVFPTLDPDGGRIARLRIPIGYWNALALLFALALPIALWLISDRRHPTAVRAAGAVFLYALFVGILLTYSRGGILAAVVALLVWLALSRRRLESVAALALTLALAAGVFAFALGRPGVVDDGQTEAVRAADGHVFGVVLVAAGVVAGLVAAGACVLERRRPVTEAARARLARSSRLGLVAAVAAAAVVAGVRGQSVAGWVEDQANEFANPPTVLLTQESSRLTSLSSNNRWTWWNEAWQAFETSPLQGTGAGSFAAVHQLLRTDPLTVTEPHDAVLQFLSDTGIVGALLACGAALAALGGAFLAVRRLEERERPAALALAAGLWAYVVHLLVDFDWSFVGVTAPVLVATGVLFAAGRSRPPRRGSLVWAPGLAALAVAGVLSLGAPWLASHRVDEAVDALGEGRPGAALDLASSARSLDPLSLDPLLARSAAESALGDVGAARSSLVTAVDQQPLDTNAWYELGAFELRVAKRPAVALRYLERARQLDPYGSSAKDLIAEIEGAG